jgi:hypothetical protein
MLAAVPTKATFLDAIATAIETLGTTDLKIGLFTGSPTLSPDTVLADLTQPTFTEYALVAATIGTRRSDANGDIILPLGLATFQPTGGTSLPQTVTGVFVQAAASPKLWLAEVLDTPWIVQDTGSALDVVFEIYIPGGEVWGGVCTTCSP